METTTAVRFGRHAKLRSRRTHRPTPRGDQARHRIAEELARHYGVEDATEARGPRTRTGWCR